MRILICDDEPAVLAQESRYVKEYFTKKGLPTPEIAMFESGEALLQDSGDKDMVFLDIEMPGISGIFTGGELKRQNPGVLIFIVTAYAEYLDEAMRINVFRYLSKPIEKERLFRNLTDAIQVYHSQSASIPIETREGLHTVRSSDIIYLEASSRKVIFHTTSGQYESVHNMQYWAEHMPGGSFYQTHRSFIINMRFVSDFNRDTVYLYSRRYVAYLTRRKYNDFKDHYLRYIEGMK